MIKNDYFSTILVYTCRFNDDEKPEKRGDAYVVYDNPELQFEVLTESGHVRYFIERRMCPVNSSLQVSIATFVA